MLDRREVVMSMSLFNAGRNAFLLTSTFPYAMQPIMTGTLASTTTNLSEMMANVSRYGAEGPQLEFSKDILPAILIKSLCLSAWQYFVLFLVGLVVYDQGKRYCLFESKLTDDVE